MHCQIIIIAPNNLDNKRTKYLSVLNAADILQSFLSGWCNDRTEKAFLGKGFCVKPKFGQNSSLSGILMGELRTLQTIHLLLLNRPYLGLFLDEINSPGQTVDFRL